MSLTDPAAVFSLLDREIWLLTARAGNRREVVSKNHPLIRGEEVAAVVEAFRGRGALGIQRQNFGGNKSE